MWGMWEADAQATVAAGGCGECAAAWDHAAASAIFATGSRGHRRARAVAEGSNRSGYAYYSGRAGFTRDAGHAAVSGCRASSGIVIRQVAAGVTIYNNREGAMMTAAAAATLKSRLMLRWYSAITPLGTRMYSGNKMLLDLVVAALWRNVR
jgi:hypothetical protein